jgi:hypothetical protein
MPPRQQYQLHRYAARPSSLAPADKSSRSAVQKRLEAAQQKIGRKQPIVVTKGFLTDLRRLARDWFTQASRLKSSAGANLLIHAAARRAKVETLERLAKALRELIEGEGV